MTKTFTEPIVPITWAGLRAHLLRLVVSPSIILCFPGLCVPFFFGIVKKFVTKKALIIPKLY